MLTFDLSVSILQDEAEQIMLTDPQHKLTFKSVEPGLKKVLFTLANDGETLEKMSDWIQQDRGEFVVFKLDRYIQKFASFGWLCHAVATIEARSKDVDEIVLDDRYSWAEYWGQGNRFGYFDGGGRCSFYAFANTEVNGTDEAEGGAVNALRSRFASYAQPVPAILDALAEPFGTKIADRPIYRDDIYDRPPLASEWGSGRVTLIGDAAHPVLPSLGQGGCMAIEDAFELATQLATITSTESVSSLLRQKDC